MDYVAIVTLELNGNTYNKGDVIAPADVPTTKLRSLVDKGLIDAVNSVGDIADGSIAPAKVTGTAVVTNDARLSDTRTPTDSSVTNAKVNASAAIAVSKLAAGTNGETISTVSGVPTWASVLPADQVANVVPKAVVGNLLTANQASIETDTTGFVGLQNVASMSASSAAALYGSKSLAVTSTGSDDTKIQLSSGLYTYDMPATAGQTYTFSAYVKSADTPRSALAVIVWRDAGGAGISTTTGTTVTTTASGWTRVLVTGVAPAGTVHAQPVITIVSSVANEVHYFDGFGFWEGAGGQWSLPGVPITDLGFYTDESVGRRLFQWDANNSRFQQTFGDTGWRAITASLENGWSAAAVYLRRTNSTVELVATTFTGAGASSGVFYTLPTGYAPISLNTYYLAAAGTGATTHSFLNNGSALTMAGTYTGVTSARLSAMWTTTAAWPTTLPGSAVGSIPA